MFVCSMIYLATTFNF